MVELSNSQKIRIAYLNGVRTVSEYARYIKAIKDPKLRDRASLQAYYDEKEQKWKQ